MRCYKQWRNYLSEISCEIFSFPLDSFSGFGLLLLLSGISRDSRHKRRATGGRKANLKKKRLYESGRPPAMTKLGATRIHSMRVRGGNTKLRALRLDHGNFSWGSEGKYIFSPDDYHGPG